MGASSSVGKGGKGSRLAETQETGKNQSCRTKKTHRAQDDDDDGGGGNSRSVRINASGGVASTSKRIVAKPDEDENGTDTEKGGAQTQQVVVAGSTSRPVVILSEEEKRERNERRAEFMQKENEKKNKILRMNRASMISKAISHILDDAVRHLSKEQAKNVEEFHDSVYIKQWLTQSEADLIFQELAEVGIKMRPKDTAEAVKAKAKYPLWSKYYGFKRRLDGALALDRWGSYHESWMRVEEPPPRLAECCSRLRSRFRLSDNDVNSMLVNFYYNGDDTYIPAHRDTTACLADGSHIIALSLGAARDFLLCDNADAGKFIKEEMKIHREWRVAHGDLFALGQQTNLDFCHAVPQEPGLTDMRISVIFRSVNRSFIDMETAPAREALYSSGNRKLFAAECITCSDYDDPGTREHLADLINERERQKKLRIDAKKLLQLQEEKRKLEEMAQIERYRLSGGVGGGGGGDGDAELDNPKKDDNVRNAAAVEVVNVEHGHGSGGRTISASGSGVHIKSVSDTPASGVHIKSVSDTNSKNYCLSSPTAATASLVRNRRQSSSVTLAQQEALQQSSTEKGLDELKQLETQFGELSAFEKEYFASNTELVASLDAYDDRTIARGAECKGMEGLELDVAMVASAVTTKHFDLSGRCKSSSQDGVIIEIGQDAGIHTVGSHPPSRRPSILTEKTHDTLHAYYMGEGFAVPVRSTAPPSRRPSILTEKTHDTLHAYYMGEGYAVPVRSTAPPK